MLASLLQRTKGARGAIFCDGDGESVDVAVGDPQLSDFEMKVLGAHAAAWLAPPVNVQEMKIRCAKGTLLCRSLRDGYYLVLLLGQGVPTGAAAFELQRTAAEVSTEL
jgi:predicted regulator of Ras-like GTPase activity (Roadblock/LC7/MglB family)